MYLFLTYSLFSTPLLHYFLYLSLYSVVGIATKLRAGWSGVQLLVGASDLCLLQNVQTGSGVHPAVYSMGTGFFPGIKQLGRDVNHPPPSSAEAKNEWSYTSSPLVCLYGVTRENFTFFFFAF